MGMVSLLMIVFQVKIVRIAGGQAEGDSPVGSNRHSPEAFSVAFERMETERWLVHGLYIARLLQRG